ncbi:hypothetical protein KSF78_0006302 [Schistosoma japonicum]|nr:hypothetical protein KSF78_0006302 [Schistosoma japonicum]
MQNVSLILLLFSHECSETVHIKSLYEISAFLNKTTYPLIFNKTEVRVDQIVRQLPSYFHVTQAISVFEMIYLITFFYYFLIERSLYIFKMTTQKNKCIGIFRASLDRLELHNRPKLLIL